VGATQVTSGCIQSLADGDRGPDEFVAGVGEGLQIAGTCGQANVWLLPRGSSGPRLHHLW